MAGRCQSVGAYRLLRLSGSVRQDLWQWTPGRCALADPRPLPQVRRPPNGRRFRLHCAHGHEHRCASTSASGSIRQGLASEVAVRPSFNSDGPCSTRQYHIELIRRSIGAVKFRRPRMASANAADSGHDRSPTVSRSWRGAFRASCIDLEPRPLEADADKGSRGKWLLIETVRDVRQRVRSEGEVCRESTRSFM